MTDRIHVLAQQILGKPSIAACDLLEIRHLVQRFPYFAPAQFLLLEKLREENDPGYQAQLQKAVLYYHNPLAFEYFISSDKFFTEMESALTVPETLVTETTQPIEEDQPQKTEEPMVQAMENNKAEEAAEVHTPEAVPLAFEPFHTVDYFASQGIRLLQEEQPQDKFGKQLKSFTEWLKTMKKLPARESAASTEVLDEKNIAHLAEDSVHDTDVVTEAMAEVWVKQGNRARALEVYNKLCLLNPSRKAYFAAKIENLKSS